jgi:hypothetical protein
MGHGPSKDSSARRGAFRRLLSFLWREKIWWMLPIVVALVLVGALLVLGASPSVAPFVYVLF